jgi:hypothetical protein
MTAGVNPAVADAQTPSKPPPRQPAGPQWEISFHGGFVTASTPPKGESQAPPAGPTFVMADGATLSRFVPSWYYGDGAVLLNQVLGLRGSPARLSALNRPPGWPVTGHSRGEVGARIARHLKGGIWFEGAVDIGLDPVGFDEDARASIEASRASFETAFTALAASAASVITASTVTSSADLDPGGRRLLVSAVVQYRGSERVVRPVLLGGVGVATSIGSPATLTLTGTYRFTTPSQAVIEETDTMRLRYETSSSLVWVFGGGVMHDLSRSSAYRVELRVRAGSTKLSADLEATPSRVITSPGGAAVLNATNPGLQFSSVGAISPSLSPVRTTFGGAFQGEGAAFQLVLSAAYVRRF